LTPHYGSAKRLQAHGVQTLSLEKAAQVLWPDCRLPAWDADQLFDVFQRHRARAPADAPPSEAERERLAQHLMNLVAINFDGRRWIESLQRIGLDPCDLAQDIVFFLLQRLDRFELRSPCVKVMLKSLNQAIRHKVMDAVELQTRRRVIALQPAPSDAEPGKSDPLDLLAANGSPDDDAEINVRLEIVRLYRRAVPPPCLRWPSPVFSQSTNPIERERRFIVCERDESYVPRARGECRYVSSPVAAMHVPAVVLRNLLWNREVVGAICGAIDGGATVGVRRLLNHQRWRLLTTRSLAAWSELPVALRHRSRRTIGRDGEERVITRGATREQFDQVAFEITRLVEGAVRCLADDPVAGGDGWR
jgi:hypothetical protein